MSWLVEFVGDVVTKHLVGSDGKTPHELSVDSCTSRCGSLGTFSDSFLFCLAPQLVQRKEPNFEKES